MKVTKTSRIFIAVAALLMIVAFFVPIWEIQMWAPQYPEWLKMEIWINDITGDISIINGLNHYIGMKHIKVEMFPEFEIMPFVLAVLIGIGIVVAIYGRRKALWGYLIILLIAGIAGMVDFYLWGYDYGHNLDPTAAIKVPGMSYQPPLLGSKELLNFIAYSGPDIGGYIIAVSGLLVMAAIGIDYQKKNQVFSSIYNKVKKMKTQVALLFCTIGLLSCNIKPEPINFGTDGCHYCKMTIMDPKFGSEVVTTKGKIYKFDDFNCMINFIEEESLTMDQIKDVLVIDYNNPGNLIDAKSAKYVHSANIKSPMASQLVACSSEDVQNELVNKWDGHSMDWMMSKEMYSSEKNQNHNHHH